MKTRRLRLKTIRKSHKKEKKWDAIFEYPDGHTKTTPFGAFGMSDYTKHKDTKRRARYIKRHMGMGETFKNPVKAQTLSRWILWGPSTSLNKNIKTFKNKFKV